MTDQQTQLEQIINGATTPDEAIAGLTSLAGRYPYFVALHAMLLKHYATSLTTEQKGQATVEVAIASPDPTMLYRITDRRAADFENFYPSEQATPEITTDDAITTFLQNYGNDSPEETELLERLIFNPVPDYTSVLSAKEPDSPSDTCADDETTLKIDAFIRSHAETEPHGENHDSNHTVVRHEQPMPADPNSLLSESLAKIYIKQRRYDKAFEIITKLSLNYPEKSCYFADQLRFLKKLIINQTSTK